MRYFKKMYEKLRRPYKDDDDNDDDDSDDDNNGEQFLQNIFAMQHKFCFIQLRQKLTVNFPKQMWWNRFNWQPRTWCKNIRLDKGNRFTRICQCDSCNDLVICSFIWLLLLLFFLFSFCVYQWIMVGCVRVLRRHHIDRMSGEGRINDEEWRENEHVRHMFSFLAQRRWKFHIKSPFILCVCQSPCWHWLAL